MMSHRTYNDQSSLRMGDEDQRLLTEEGMKSVYTRVQNYAQGGGKVAVVISAWWRGSMRWARNRVSLASDQRDILIDIIRSVDDATAIGSGSVRINQVDDASLAGAVRAAERKMRIPGIAAGEFKGLKFQNPLLPYPETAIWSEATSQVTPEQQATLAQTLTHGAEERNLLSAGYMQMFMFEQQRFGEMITDVRDWIQSTDPPQGRGASRMARDVGYIRHTEAQCSMTVRHPKGLGSGWAGLSGYDWSVIDSGVLAQRALDKCVASLNPVAIEPGRFVVILEPQAVSVFAGLLVDSISDRSYHELPYAPGLWSEDLDPTLKMRMTKLGQTVVDSHISITHDPMDPQLGTLPEPGLRPVTWIEKGVLTTLSYERQKYSVPTLRENLPTLGRPSFRMTGGTTTMEEMIETTPRGLIVTRFSSVDAVPGGSRSLLYTGVTRDGLWLVENGKISKPVKNMRFTDSPLFVFNQVEQLGIPVPVFSPGERILQSRIVPSVKSRDFAFTSTIDAI